MSRSIPTGRCTSRSVPCQSAVLQRPPNIARYRSPKAYRIEIRPGDERKYIVPEPENPSILVVSDFPDLPKKIATHFEPLAETGADLTIVCITPNAEFDDAEYVTVPSWPSRYVGLLLLPFVALLEGMWRDYDAVVSFSLFPYGLYALVLGRALDLPAHLGIIGIDLDHHATARYGAFPRFAFRRFDTLSVPGETHRSQLAGYGVDRDSIFVLANSIDPDVYHPDGSVETRYDFVWCGRLSPEKDPLLFVDALAELAESVDDFDAVVLGSGALYDEVDRRIVRHGLTEHVELMGWVDEPVTYYRQSRAFVLTSRRDALSTSLIEAMATGLPCITPPVGNVSDVVEDGHNGFVFERGNVDALADALERIVDDRERAAEMGRNATAVTERYSRERASEDWRRILDGLMA